MSTAVALPRSGRISRPNLPWRLAGLGISLEKVRRARKTS